MSGDIGFEAGGGWAYCRECDTRYGLSSKGVRRAWFHTLVRHPLSFARIVWGRWFR